MLVLKACTTLVYSGFSLLSSSSPVNVSGLACSSHNTTFMFSLRQQVSTLRPQCSLVAVGFLSLVAKSEETYYRVSFCVTHGIKFFETVSLCSSGYHYVEILPRFEISNPIVLSSLASKYFWSVWNHFFLYYYYLFIYVKVCC